VYSLKGNYERKSGDPKLPLMYMGENGKVLKDGEENAKRKAILTSIVASYFRGFRGRYF